eukprot:gb/GECH01012160.1/.p1 GENE.gb/GECH01012160.1/~~gb/GECH01012160.1/.p1  ORF type:complete len:239 (+),score=56.46 gb/GECH01012160.1/:1-717(+)
MAEEIERVIPCLKKSSPTQVLVNLLLKNGRVLPRQQLLELAEPYYSGNAKKEGVYKFIWGSPRRWTKHNPKKSPLIFEGDHVFLDKNFKPKSSQIKETTKITKTTKRNKNKNRKNKRKKRTRLNRVLDGDDPLFSPDLFGLDRGYNKPKKPISEIYSDAILPENPLEWSAEEVKLHLSLRVPRLGKEYLEKIVQEDINGENFIQLHEPIIVADIFNMPFGIAMDFASVSKRQRAKVTN